jgi:hypothetical protein
MFYMNRLHDTDVIQLAEQQADPSVSFYLPTTSAPDQQDKNRIRLKNLVAEGSKILVDKHGLRQVEVEEIMAPTQRLIANGRFWLDTNEPGLAIFLTANNQTLHRLPIPFAERVLVSDRFYLKPLLPVLARNGRFYILALSLGNIQLFEATQYGIGEIPLSEKVPRSIDEALQWDDPEKSLQWHTSTDSGVDRPAAFHGHGVTNEETKKENILRYCQKIDAALKPILHEDDAPLILVALDYLGSIYAQVNSYKQMLGQTIKIDPQSLPVQELHQRAWQEVIQPYFTQKRNQAAASLNNLIDTERTAVDLAEIVRAAHQGQIDTLFIAKDQEKWGSYDASTHRVTIHDHPATGLYDLVDLAAVQTLRQGGAVFVVEKQAVPQQQIMAAKFRYPGY